MRRKTGWIYAIWMSAAMLTGTFEAAEPVSLERPAFKSLRYDEDYTFLRDVSSNVDFWDSLKYIPLSKAGDVYLSIGGEARAMVEAFRNESFSTAEDADSVYLLQRYLLHLDTHLGDHFRVFAQLQSAFEDGKPGNGDQNTLDLHQLFFDVAINLNVESNLTFRAGRQELSFGSERLLGVREGTNNRRAFDAARLIYKTANVRVEGFIASPLESDPHVFDDQRLRDVWLWGVYATFPIEKFPETKLDLYYLGLHKPSASFSQGIAKEERHTFGARFFGTFEAWDFNHEAIYQTGRFGEGNINAWSVATDHGYTFNNTFLKPRLGLKAAIASGDSDPQNADLETFNPLFPRGNYFSEASLLGPQNFMDIRPSLSLQPTEKFSLEISADFYWRQSLDDGIYRPSGSVIYEGNNQLSRFVGTDLSLSATWLISRHLTFGLACTHFFTGSFIQDNGGADVDYASLWLTYRF